MQNALWHRLEVAPSVHVSIQVELFWSLGLGPLSGKAIDRMCQSREALGVRSPSHKSQAGCSISCTVCWTEQFIFLSSLCLQKRATVNLFLNLASISAVPLKRVCSKMRHAKLKAAPFLLLCRSIVKKRQNHHQKTRRAYNSSRVLSIKNNNKNVYLFQKLLYTCMCSNSEHQLHTKNTLRIV